jgi:RND superfamily putative drug exporter
VAAVSPVRLSPTGTAAVLELYPTTSPQAAATDDLLTHLRHTVIPRAVAGSGLVVHVGGETATAADFASVLSSKLPLFIGVVVGLSFLLLLLAFRSLLIPTVAALMNLLSAGAAFGVMVAVFQWGWGRASLASTRPGPSRPSFPCSSSPSSSACPWTTRSSWSAACARPG